MNEGPVLREIATMTLLRIKLFLREPEAVFWIIFVPVILTVVVGFAFRSNEPGPSRIAVLGKNKTPTARLAARLSADPKQIAVERMTDEVIGRRKLRKGAIDALVFPGTPPRVRSDPNRPQGELAQLRITALLSEPAPRAVTAPERRSERGSRYVDFLFFGLLGMNVMGTGLYGVGFAIADLRRRKLLRRLLVTPMRRTSMILSLMLSRLVFLAGAVLVLTVFGALALGVPMGGSWIHFSLLCLVGGFAFSGFGLLLASRAQTIEGLSGLMNFATIPMWLASGVFFSYERLPEPLQLPIRLLPLAALNDGLRAMMLDNRSLLDLPLECAVLVGWAIVPLVVALKIFRWD